MASNTKASTSSGVPSHLESTGLAGVASSAPPLPRPDVEQYAPDPMLQGVTLPIDPLLALAGAYWNDQRQLVRKVVKHAGPPREINGRLRQPIVSSERYVAPPGMTIEDARLRGLDFFSPQFGWVRAGVKFERENPQNLGTGGNPDNVEYVDAEAEQGQD